MPERLLSADQVIIQFHLAYPGFSLDVNLELPRQGVTALFGPSGSGKTTLLRCVAGLERATDAYLAIAGEVWQDAAAGVFLPTHKRSLGYVFQEPSLFPHLTVRRNLEYGRKRASAREVSLSQMVDLLDIGSLLNRMPDTLSGGERQRVAIARALATRPRILLMDEPLAALDIRRKGEILPYLERLHDELRIPILYVSHAPDEIVRLADHLVLLTDGTVLGSGPLTETLARLDLSTALDDDPGVVLDTVVGQHDEAYHLTRLDFPGGGVWVRDARDPIGRKVRVRILARDVSLALARPRDTSILNSLPATVVGIGEDTHPAQVLVRLDAGGASLLARITCRSRDALRLRPGVAIWAQIKAVALLR